MMPWLEIMLNEAYPAPGAKLFMVHQQIRDLADEGYTVQQIARGMGVTRQSVNKSMQNANIPRPSHR